MEQERRRNPLIPPPGVPQLPLAVSASSHPHNQLAIQLAPAGMARRVAVAFGCCCAFVLLPAATAAFQTPLPTRAAMTSGRPGRTAACRPSLAAPAAGSSRPSIRPARFVKLRGEVITPIGLLLSLSVFATAFLVQIPVFLTYSWSLLFDKKRRRGVDWIIHFWAWAVRTAARCPWPVY